MKRTNELSLTQKKLVAESLCQIAVNLASARNAVPAATLMGVRESLVRELLALNATVPEKVSPP